MPSYVVLAPPPSSPSELPDPVDYVFVKDGFCWPCLVTPEVWMVFRRLWLVLLLYLAAFAVVLIVARIVGGPLPALFLALAHLFFALEANALRMWTLRRRGYEVIGVARGRRVAEAEIRFFNDVQSARPDWRLPPPARLQTAAGNAGPVRGPSAESGEVVGLFPAPGGTS
jgi:hypothetical protein